MSLHDHPRAYGAAALAVAFGAGALMALGLQDVYPDLEQRCADSQSRRRIRRAIRQADAATLRRRASTATSVGVHLEDREAAGDEANADADEAWSLLGGSLGSSLGSLGPRALPVLGSSRAGIADGLADCIGDTPLVRLASLSAATGREILAKAEFLNPGGSPKDRVALSIIRTAEAAGQLVPHRGDTIYEGTSGSTGISLALLARALGYRAHIFMTDDMAVEKSRLLVEMGAVVERVPVVPIVDPAHFVHRARAAAAAHASTHADGSRGFFADQFESPANAEAHRRTTGPEILRQTTTAAAAATPSSSSPADPLAAFVCGAGTAGTLTGVARFLKEDAGLRGLRVVAADPQGSGLYHLVRSGVLYATTEREGTRRRSQVDSIVEGIGINRMTATLEAGLHLIDDAVTITDDQACHMARWLVRHDGVFAGSSTAVNCAAAVVVAMTLPPGSRVVTLLCDGGQRHLSKFYKVIDEMDGKDDDDDDADDEHADLLAMMGLKTGNSA